MSHWTFLSISLTSFFLVLSNFKGTTLFNCILYFLTFEKKTTVRKNKIFLHISIGPQNSKLDRFRVKTFSDVHVCSQLFTQLPFQADCLFEDCRSATVRRLCSVLFAPGLLSARPGLVSRLWAAEISTSARITVALSRRVPAEGNLSSAPPPRALSVEEQAGTCVHELPATLPPTEPPSPPHWGGLTHRRENMGY